MLPWEDALSELAGWDPVSVVSQGRWKELYVAISWIMRQYLERRFRILALEETSHEIAESLRGSHFPGALESNLIACLQACDQVKYAKSVPSTEEAAALHALARSIVEETIPRQEAAA